MKIDALSPTSTAPASPGGVPSKVMAQAREEGFDQLLKGAVSKVNRQLLEAQELSRQMAMGKEVDLADTMVALTKADISFRLLMQVRNRAIGAYEEIMRLQF